MSSRKASSHQALFLLSAVLFAVLLVLPVADKIFAFAPKTTVAEAGGKSLPVLTRDPATWEQAFDTLRHGYLERHFGLRNLLIACNNYLDTFVFKTTTPSSQVLVGRDNWLFLSQDGSGRNIVEDSHFVITLPEGKLAAVAKELTRRKDWLAKRGIRYLVIVAPNKNTVYPEKLPSALKPSGEESPFNQLMDYLHFHTSVDIVDVTPALMAAKQKEQVYYSADSHWNAKGAFAAYEKIIVPLKREFPAIRPLTREQFEVESFVGLPGDLAFMMGLSDHFKENRIMFINKAWYKARGNTFEGEMDPRYFDMPQRSTTHDASLPSAVIFHDSFWWELLPFMAESFNRALYVWMKPETETEPRYFDTELIRREKPDVVIDEFTERYFVPVMPNHLFAPKNDTAAVKK